MKFDQKVLVARFSSIGDIVQSTSPLKTIRNAYPDAQITFLTLDDYAPILELNPDIDYLLTIKRKQTYANDYRYGVRNKCVKQDKK